MRELFDKDGPLKSIQLECLMPKVGSRNTLKAFYTPEHKAYTPEHLPDIGCVPLGDIIYGPLNVTPKARESRAYEVEDYDNLKRHFDIVKKVNLKEVLPYS